MQSHKKANKENGGLPCKSDFDFVLKGKHFSNKKSVSPKQTYHDKNLNAYGEFISSQQLSLQKSFENKVSLTQVQEQTEHPSQTDLLQTRLNTEEKVTVDYRNDTTDTTATQRPVETLTKSSEQKQIRVKPIKSTLLKPDQNLIAKLLKDEPDDRYRYLVRNSILHHVE